MSTSIQVYTSPRGMPLVWMQPPAEVPVLTVENWVKWYELFLVRPDGSVVPVWFSALEEVSRGETSWCDHVPNPALVRRLASKNNWHMDANALEMIIGRWEIEYRDNYDEDL